MTEKRIERDSLGAIEVAGDRLWGAQTERARINFPIGGQTMPIEVIHALALIKKAAAIANHELDWLDRRRMELICAAADEAIAGTLDDHFPLTVWMSGSGTQANMNVNEVIANRADEMAGSARGAKELIHPNDHVNMSQSSNDAFPAAMHISTARMARERLLPAVRALKDALTMKADEWKDIVKMGRTHLQDAIPLTLGQEFSAYAAQLDQGLACIEHALGDIYKLVLGGTAIGTGLNAPAGFTERAIGHLAKLTGLPFAAAPNAFAGIAAHDALVAFSGALRVLSVSLKKIAGDIALMGSGPRGGLGELFIPANEPGSSIMPGKVNPSQCEAMAMVAVQVMGNDAAVGFAGASGQLELNVYKPLIIFNVLQSMRLLSDACASFAHRLVVGLKPNRAAIERHVQESLMLVTALTPAIGYDRAAEIAQYAHEHGITLKNAALKLGFVSEADFERIVDPYAMATPHRRPS